MTTTDRGNAETLTPHVYWAPRQDRVYVSVEVPEPKDVKVALDNKGKITVNATSGNDNSPYHLDLDLYGEIDKEQSEWKTTGRLIEMKIARKESGEYWPKLHAGNQKLKNVSVDWDKWVDEDEEDEYEWSGEGQAPMNMEDLYKYMPNLGQGGEGGGLPTGVGEEETGGDEGGTSNENQQGADISDLDQ